MKMSFQKSRKFCIFSKGLTHDFGQKLEIFSRLIFPQRRPRCEC